MIWIMIFGMMMTLITRYWKSRNSQDFGFSASSLVNIIKTKGTINDDVSSWETAIHPKNDCTRNLLGNDGIWLHLKDSCLFHISVQPALFPSYPFCRSHHMMTKSQAFGHILICSAISCICLVKMKTRLIRLT